MIQPVIVCAWCGAEVPMTVDRKLNHVASGNRFYCSGDCFIASLQVVALAGEDTE